MVAGTAGYQCGLLSLPFSPSRRSDANRPAGHWMFLSNPEREMSKESGHHRTEIRTLASEINLLSVSVAHFRFMEGLGKSSQEIFMKPLPQSARSPTPASAGGTGVHLGPASSLNLCSAFSPFKGNSSRAATMTRLIVTGCGSPW